MKNTIRRAAVGAAALATVAGASLAGAPSAHANSFNGCPYPYVCIATSFTGPNVAAFKDVTSYYQGTTHRTHWIVRNTRNDDVVYVHYYFGGKLYNDCVRPNTALYSFDGKYTIVSLRISSSPKC